MTFTYGRIFWLALLGVLGTCFLVFTFTMGGGRISGPGVFLTLAVLCLALTARFFVQAAQALVLSGAGEREEDERVVGRRKKELEREYLAIKRALKELELDHAMGKLSDGDYGEIRGRYRERAVRILRRLDQGHDFHKQIELDLRARRQALPAGAVAAVTADADAAPTPIERSEAERRASIARSEAERRASIERSEAERRAPIARSEAERRAPIARSEAERRALKKKKRPEMKIPEGCAACGTSNDGDALFCKKCGARLSPS